MCRQLGLLGAGAQLHIGVGAILSRIREDISRGAGAQRPADDLADMPGLRTNNLPISALLACTARNINVYDPVRERQSDPDAHGTTTQAFSLYLRVCIHVQLPLSSSLLLSALFS